MTAPLITAADSIFEALDREPKPRIEQPEQTGPIRYHADVEQGSIAWLKLRCGLLTASEMKLILTSEGGQVVTKYRSTGVAPERLTAARSKALASIGERAGTVRELAFLADVGEGVIRGLVDAGALEAFKVETPLIFKPALDDKERAHLYELLAQRITGYVEPHFESYDMERGKFDEQHARAKYAETYAPIDEIGLITNDKLGFEIGYSPDGLVGDDGLIEVKSRVQKWQMQTLVEFVANETIPADFLIQVQTGLFVAERQWLDFISYSGGMQMAVVRCFPDPVIAEAIGNAATAFERRLAEKREIYEKLIASKARLVPTERLIYL